VFAACFPPLAWHDGLPAWSPEQGDVEWRVGYQRLSFFDADTFELFGESSALPDFSFGYLTPGVRWGLRQRPVAADVGITSVAIAGSRGLLLLVGPAFGVGHCDQKYSVTLRQSCYVLALDVESKVDLEWGTWYQGELLFGNGYRPRGVSFAAGGRASPLAAGLVGIADVGVRPADIRAEVSYMWPMASLVTGRALTVGVTVAAPKKR
jgi:hypothetical protein